MKRVVSEVRDETLAASKELGRTLDTTFWTKPPEEPRPMGIQSKPWSSAEAIVAAIKWSRWAGSWSERSTYGRPLVFLRGFDARSLVSTVILRHDDRDSPGRQSGWSRSPRFVSSLSRCWRS